MKLQHALNILANSVPSNPPPSTGSAAARLQVAITRQAYALGDKVRFKIKGEMEGVKTESTHTGYVWSLYLMLKEGKVRTFYDITDTLPSDKPGDTHPVGKNTWHKTDEEITELLAD